MASAQASETVLPKFLIFGDTTVRTGLKKVTNAVLLNTLIENSRSISSSSFRECLSPF